MLAWIVMLGGVLGYERRKIAKAFCVGIQRDGGLLGYLGLLELYPMKKYMVL